MSRRIFDYEKVFMGVRNKKPKTYQISFSDDYRIRLLTKVIPSRRMHILDVGSGGGMLTESLPYYFPNAVIHGCDISRTAISYAKKFGSGTIPYGVIRGKHFPYKDSVFDICICLDVLEHVPDIEFFLQEVKRVLKKNGKFFLVVPCENERFTFTWLFQAFGFGEKLTFKYFGHIHPEFTHDYIAKLLQSYKFVIERKTYSEHAVYQVLQFIIYFLPKILLEAIFGEHVMNRYSDSDIVRNSRRKRGLLLLVRSFWFRIMRLIRYPMYWETLILGNVSYGAWKIHVLARRNSHAYE